MALKIDDAMITSLLYTDVPDSGIIQAEIDAHINDFDFVGFNPRVIAQIMLAKANDKNVLLRDVSILCFIAAKRGFKWDKIVNRMSNTGITTMNTLRTKYGIVQQEASTLKATDITLQRVVASFPVIFMNASAKGYRYIGYSKPSEFKFPILYCSTAGGIFISDDHFPAWMSWAEEYNFIINKGNESGWNKTKNIIAQQRSTRNSYHKDVLTAIDKIATGADAQLRATAVPTGLGVEVAYVSTEALKEQRELRDKYAAAKKAQSQPKAPNQN
jgi:16S rRNA U1498 N3-methylase RsmE